MKPEELMQHAVNAARDGLRAGQSPFGCAIFHDGKLTLAHNTVIADCDPTAHAEVNAIRRACLSVEDVFLPGAIVASTCEPCPMCAAALNWTRVKQIYFGASIAAAQSAGFNEITLAAETVLRQGSSPIPITGGVLAAECEQLFKEWLEDPTRHAY